MGTIPDPTAIPYGLCHCGCGQKAPIARDTDRGQGKIKGQPQRYILGHQRRKHVAVPPPIYDERYTGGFPVAVGYCGCGCGEKAPLATTNHVKCGYKVGEPIRFIHGHHNRLPAYQKEAAPLPDIPPRLCACGCGDVTRRIKKNNGDYKRGEYMRYLRGHALRLSPVEYIIQDCGYTTPCWLWQRGKTSGGYGAMNDESGRLLGAHQLYYTRAKGPVPDGLILDHLCRQHSCVNPNHLDPVPYRINTRRGHNAKLVQAQVKEIRASPLMPLEIAPLYGVCEGTIRDIRSGRTWAVLD